MFKNKEKGIGSEKGFTMIELIIVIAIMGILSAILVPSFTQMTRKSRLRADISTIQQVQTQIDLYVAEHDGEYPGADTSDLTMPPTDIIKAMKTLKDGEYIKASDLGTDNSLKLQTAKAQVVYDSTKDYLVLDVGPSDKKIQKTAGTLGENDKNWMTGYTEENK